MVIGPIPSFSEVFSPALRLIADSEITDSLNHFASDEGMGVPSHGSDPESKREVRPTPRTRGEECAGFFGFQDESLPALELSPIGGMGAN